MHQHRILGDTIYFWFGSNDTSGSGDDGASAVYDVRLAGAAAGTSPALSGSAILLTHANFPAGCYEVAIAATVGNGFVAGNTYAVFCTLTVDAQNPTGFVGSFSLEPIIADIREVGGDEQSATDLKDFADNGYDPATNKIETVKVADALTGHTVQTGDNYPRLGNPAGVSIAADIAENQTDLNAILADTNELQGDWTNGGRLDNLIDAIKTVTDLLPDGGALTTLLNNVAAILIDTGTDGVVVAAASKTGYTLSNTGMDNLLQRPISNSDAAGTFRSLYGAICKLVNRFDTTTEAGKATIYKTNDVDILAKQTISEDAAANPIVGLNTD